MRTPAALLCGVAMAVAIALPLAWLAHGLSAWHGGVALISLTLGVATAIWVWMITPNTATSPPRSFWNWLMIGIFTCASGRSFLWLITSVEDQWKILSPYNLGDLSLHLAFIHWLASTTHWWPASPILAGDPLRYPLGSDLFNSLLLVAGIPVIQGLLWYGLGGAALTGYALWRWGGGMALAAFLFNGGMAGLLYFQGKNPDEVCEWKNLFLTLFVTQRGFLFSLPAGLLLLSAWREENFGKDRRIVLPLPMQVLLLAVTPLFSIHTALYLGVAMAGVALAVPIGRKRFVKLAVCAWPFMALLGWLVATGAGGPSALHSIGWHLGWMSDGTMKFWFWNFGISLPLALLLALLLFRKDSDQETSTKAINKELCQARAFVWPATFVFLCCMVIRFAPWPWDNMKLMLWSWIVIAPYLWIHLLQNRSCFIRVPALVLLFGSGFFTLIAGLDGRHGYDLIKRSDLAETSWLLRNLPVEAVIACAPEYNHPVLVLGHPIVCGYEGHLWSHGLDYQGRLETLNSIMNGESNWQAKARGLAVAVIYWSELERTRWPDSKLPWAKEESPSLHQVK